MSEGAAIADSGVRVRQARKRLWCPSDEVHRYYTLAPGLGTMIGWKRIVVTVGAKMRKTHLSYAHGAPAELVAMGTNFHRDQMGLPVSTTQVLSSGLAGTMAANGSGLQMDSCESASRLGSTLPVCVPRRNTRCRGTVHHPCRFSACTEFQGSSAGARGPFAGRFYNFGFISLSQQIYW